MNKNRILSLLTAAILLGTTVAAPIGEAQAAQQEGSTVISMGTDFTNTEIPDSSYEYYKDVRYVLNEGGATLSHSAASNVDILYEEASGYYFKDLNQNGALDTYEDWRLSSLERAKSLAAQLSTEQRLALMTHGSTGKTKEEMTEGTRFNLTRSTSAADTMAEDNNKLQYWAEDTPEMFGIPVVTSTDPRHTGIVDSGTIETTEPGGTVSKWPNNMGIAATFDADTAYTYGDITAAEYRALGIQMMLGPQMDLITDPRWSRDSSAFSEDPELAADMSSAFIEAMQTDDNYQESDWGIDEGWGTGSVATIAKHWPSGGTGEFGFDAHKDDGKFGVYPAGNFEELLQYFVEGAGFAEEYKGTTKQSAGVMPYYTIPFEQDPSGENVANGFSKYIVQQRLREDLNYDGLVCTDWKIHGSHEGMGGADTPWGLEPGKGYDRPYRILASMLAGVDQMGGLDSDEYVMEDMLAAYDMGVNGSEKYGIEALGEEFMDELTEASATRILKVIFNLGLFEDPYTDPDYAKSFVGSPELNAEAYETHKDAVIMTKNSNNTLPLQAEDGEELTAYVPLKESTGGGFPGFPGFPGGGESTTTVESVIDLDTVQKYYNVPDSLVQAVEAGEMPSDEEKAQAASEADFAIIELQSPSMAMEYTDGRPQNLTYGEYTADAMREVSIGYDWYHADGTLVQYNETPDESKGDYKSNRSRKGNTHAGTPENLELIQKTVELMGDKPIIFILSMENPMVVSEFEPSVDAMLIGTSVSPDAFLEVISGQTEPSGLLPVNMPASMEAVETAYEDGYHDMEVYVDSDGNAYSFGFGLDWDGQIADERTAKYTDIGDPNLEKTTFPDTYDEKYLVVESQEVRDEKVEALLNTMTTEEKFSLLGGGEKTGVADAGTIQGVPRLGIPELRMFDGPDGVTSIYDTTNPPIEQMLASTWSTDLAYDYGKVSGSENQAISGNVQLGSQFDITRTAHFGRSKDQMGEDPFLLSRLAVEETKGIQDQNVLANLKHFAVFAQDSTPGGAVDVQIDEQTLHELYLAPFEAAIKEADAASVMSSYNGVNGAWASASTELQIDILRDEWGFDGFTVTDWGGNHAYTLDKGTDVEMPSVSQNTQAATEEKIANGEMTWDDVDEAVSHVLNAMGKVGYLYLVELDGKGYVKEEPGRTEPIKLPDTYAEKVEDGLLEENQEIALEVAEKGAVLLKNDDETLPLDASASSIGMIGLGAVNPIAGGSGQERSFGTLSRMVSPYDRIVEIAGEDADIEATAGLDIVGTTIPAEYLYQDENGEQNGVVRKYGVEGNPGTPIEINGQIFWMGKTDPVDMEGYETGTVANIDEDINFNTGTTTYKNGPDGTAFENGSAYTWETYLRAPEDGEYTIVFSGIGGTISGKITVDGQEQSIGNMSLREGSQWPWNNVICTSTGMDISNTTVTLEAGKLYKVKVTGVASLDLKDLQVRLGWITPSQKQENYDEAIRIASENENVVFFAWRSTGAEGNTIEDCSLALPEDQEALLLDVIAAAKENGNKVTVVLNNGGAVTMDKWVNDVDAVLEMWYPGQEGGLATARILLGEVNPSGKLAQTFMMYDNETPVTDSQEHFEERLKKSEEETGDGVNQPKNSVYYTEGIMTGYRWYDSEDIDPLFSFGHGLSYTTFSYSDMQVEENDENGFDVTFTVTNTGDVAGDEIAQVYLGAAEVPDGVQMAEKQLAGFARIEDLQPGESREVTISISQRSLSYWNTNSEYVTRADGTKDKWTVAEGERAILVGASAGNLPLEATVNVKAPEESENSNLSVQYGTNVKLFVNGEEQKIANLVGDYEGTFATGETVTLTFEPAVDGREIAGVTVNGEAVDFEDTDSFTYTLQAGEADELAFAFTTVDKSVLLAAIEAANACEDEIEDVIPSVLENFEEALEKANAVYKDLTATQEEIDQAWSDLIDAMQYLSFQSGSKTYLEYLLSVAEKIDTSDYIQGVTAFKDAYEAAQKVYDDPDALADEITNAAEALEEALLGLVRGSEKDMLRTVIEKANSLDLDEYVEAGKEAFNDALAHATDVLYDDQATQEEVEEATETLNAAMEALRKVADKSALDALIATVEGLNLNRYTAASVATLEDTLAKAKAMAADATLSEDDQQEVDAMTDALQDAKDQLKVKTTDSHSSSSSSSGSSASANIYGNAGTSVVGAATTAQAAAQVVSDTTVNFTLKRGSAYCFKMTVVNGNNLTPSFTVGNGDVLKTQFVAKVGNDYYYRVYAVGTPGQSTGVYTTLPGNTPVKHCAVTIG